MAQNLASQVSNSIVLDSQYVYIKSLEIRYHNDEIANIRQSAIRAFIRELQEKRKVKYRVVVFNSPPKQFGFTISPDAPLESQRDYIERKEREYAPTNFEDYPLYHCCDIDGLLNDTTVLVLTRLSMPTTGKIELNLTALIPKQDEKPSFFPFEYDRVKIDYSFTLELKEANNGMNAIYYNIKMLEDDLKWYYSPPKHPRDVKSINGVHQNFAWIINSVKLRQIKSIKINNESTVDSIYALFTL